MRMNKSDRVNRDSVLGIIKHIVSGWTYDSWWYDYGSKSSPWISTTTDFRWAIWEIARRLTKLNRDQVELTRTSEDCYGFCQIGFGGVVPWRIFDKDVLESTTWTRYSTPFDLPEYCYIAEKYWTNGESWLDRLVWNPRLASFYDADEMMSKRDEQISSSRQPSRR
ncbi:uncharacterized protein L199_003918 [Kwoniella botswanensis]|uniref:uncharacterized protein n=1 Tax=Kwoniella botswanensis TaxID=1268659 RepID=UPI00315C9466